MHLVVVGSRNFKNKKLVSTFLDLLCDPYLDTVVSGGAEGPDTWAEEWSKETNTNFKAYLPDWNKYGKKAGIMRNTEMVEDGDLILAFWDGKSRGTQDTIRKAMKLKVPLYLFVHPGGEERFID